MVVAPVDQRLAARGTHQVRLERRQTRVVVTDGDDGVAVLVVGASSSKLVPKNPKRVQTTRVLLDVPYHAQIVVEPQPIANLAAVTKAVVLEVALETGVRLRKLPSARRRLRGAIESAGGSGISLSSLPLGLGLAPLHSRIGGSPLTFLRRVSNTNFSVLGSPLTSHSGVSSTHFRIFGSALAFRSGFPSTEFGIGSSLRSLAFGITRSSLRSLVFRFFSSG